MSNVLIGIIGVILFIGLALAGALFFGPRFQEASTNSKVAAAVQAVSQTTNAIRMYEVQEGERVTLSSIGNTLDTPTEENRSQIVDGGYLKAIPANPLNAGGIYVANMDGRRMVHMMLGSTDDLCRNVNRIVGQGDVANIPFSSTSTQIGCARYEYEWGLAYILWEAI